MLLRELDDFSEYFRDIVSFLQEFSWLYKTPVTNILISDVFSKIPCDWTDCLASLSDEELNNVPVGLIKVTAMLLRELDDFSEYFRDIVSFLQEFSWLYKTPVTNILISDVFSKIPCDWTDCLASLSDEELNNVPVGLIKDNWAPSLQKFLRDCKRLTLPELADETPLHQQSCSDDWLESVPREMWRGMSQKKRQEVEMMSDFVHHECKLFGINNIVDLGSGLGYIDRMLLLRGYKILGIESQAKLVNFATIQKDNFFPNDIAASINYANMNISEKSISEVRNAILSSFFEVTKKPTLKSKENENKNKYDWERLFSHCRDVSTDGACGKVCMIGLHACGDLAVTALKLYLSLSEVSALVLIPCCYHKMALVNCQHPGDDDLEAEVEEKFHNIPLSESLTTGYATVGESFICRPILRLASQATNSGWLGWSELDHQQHSFNVLSRAVVELYAQKENATFKKCFRRLVRKTLLKDQDFSNYVDEILNRSEFSHQSKLIDLKKDREKMRSDLLSLWAQHQDKLRLVEVVTGLQMCLEPVVESLIVADRICFLKEQKVDNVRVVRIIDNKLSPRCLAYVASKG